jgi:hypothetical protein
MKVVELIGMFIITLYFFWFCFKLILETISYKKNMVMNIIKFNISQQFKDRVFSTLFQSVSI